MTTNDNVARLNAAEIQDLGKSDLRAACKARSISYAKLTVAGMRETILAWEEHRVLASAGPDAVLAATPIKSRKEQAQRTSVMSILRSMEVGVPQSIDAIVQTTGVKRASLITTALSCNSTAPSNARLYGTGLRFKREGDKLVRTA